MSEERKTIYLCLAHMSEAGLEQKYVKEAFDTNWVVPLGPNVNAFEKDLENFVGEGKKVVALSAGTAAVHLALLACGVGPGDEVCVQSFTFCASSHPITYLGATPVFIDSEKDSWNMDPDLLEEAIKDRIAKTGKKPKAIVPVALYGMPYDCDRIMDIANRYDIPVIEDYCHIAPGVNISGCTTIGEETWIGVGSSVIQCLNIGKNCMVGAGSVVVKDIPDNVLAYGNPCRIIRNND